MEGKVVSGSVGTVDVGAGGGNGHGGGGGAEGALPIHTKQIGLWALMAVITMLFAGFSSAYIVRRAGADWQPIPFPPILWLNTAVLVASSLTMEAARRALRAWRYEGLKRWLTVTGVLGLLFLGGQLWAWRTLVQQGIFMPTNPHSSFFYLLTAVHGLHLLGGLIALAYVLIRAWQHYYTPYHPGVGLCATYWHFMDALWVYLFLLLFVF